MPTQRLKRFSIALVALFGLALAVAPMANAAPSGTTVNGCRAPIFSTAFSMNCTNVSATGTYQTKGTCSAQSPRYGGKVELARKASVKGVSPGQCTFKVNSGQALKVK